MLSAASTPSIIEWSWLATSYCRPASTPSNKSQREHADSSASIRVILVQKIMTGLCVPYHSFLVGNVCWATEQRLSACGSAKACCALHCCSLPCLNPTHLVAAEAATAPDAVLLQPGQGLLQDCVTPEGGGGVAVLDPAGRYDMCISQSQPQDLQGLSGVWIQVKRQFLYGMNKDRAFSGGKVLQLNLPSKAADCLTASFDAVLLTRAHMLYSATSTSSHGG
jgi:hypothetical protein